MGDVRKPQATWNPDLVRKMAMTLTGHKGPESLNRFAKQLIIGAVKDKGFWDKSNDLMTEVYERPFVVLGSFNALSRFSFLNDRGSYVWDFAGGVEVGQKLSGFASNTGRHSNWVGDGAKKAWEEQNVTCVILVGFHSSDVEFFHIERDAFLALGVDRLNLKKDSPQAIQWKKSFEDLVLQPTFGSLLGVSQ
jgi:hypothetical protein